MKQIINHPCTVRWGDLDAFGHVNNTLFLRYVEEARVQWFLSLDRTWSEPESAPILAAIQMNFRKPIRWPETVRVELYVERIGTKSLSLAHKLFSTTKSDLLYADGNAVMVWVDRSANTVPLPDAVRSACS